MSKSLETIQLVAKYLSETEQKHITAAEVQNKLPWYKIVGIWWDAIVHYKMTENFFLSLDDVPEGKDLVNIRVKRGEWMEYHKTLNGEWKKVGELKQEFYKG